MRKRKVQPADPALPKLAAPTAKRAISIVNYWLRNEEATLVRVRQATFNPATYCWHLPVQLSRSKAGAIMFGDIYLHAATGQFLGCPSAEELQQRATALAEILRRG
jgi:hypothetical protein